MKLAKNAAKDKGESKGAIDKSFFQFSSENTALILKKENIDLTPMKAGDQGGQRVTRVNKEKVKRERELNTRKSIGQLSSETRCDVNRPL